jgi:hypothetical protein
LFDPTNPLALLKAAVQGVNIKTATVLTLDTALATGGIHNIPFVVKRANATPNAGGVLYIEATVGGLIVGASICRTAIRRRARNSITS